MDFKLSSLQVMCLQMYDAAAKWTSQFCHDLKEPLDTIFYESHIQWSKI